MDRELIAMCACPEIQDRWEPKVGDMYCDSSGNVIWQICKHDAESGTYSAWKHCVLKNSVSPVIYIPRIEDVLEWLGGRLIQILRETNRIAPLVWQVDYFMPFGDNLQASVGVIDESLMKALLKAYMHLDHGKSWNGKEWV